ncbi:F-box/LRR-repeat protein 4 [Bienertia sinuspersici]
MPALNFTLVFSLHFSDETSDSIQGRAFVLIMYQIHLRNVGDSMQVGRSGNDHCADTILRLQPYWIRCPSSPHVKGNEAKMEL